MGAQALATLASRLPAGLACLVAIACAGGSPAASDPALPATGRTPGGALYRVTVAPSLDPRGPDGRPVTAWCPRVDFRAPARRPTHGAVGCRDVRRHVPTGGFALFCRSSDIFVLLLSSRATRSVSVTAATGRAVALEPYGEPGLDGRFWLAHYQARSSPRAVASVEGAGRFVQRYPVIACIGRSPTNGLLGR